MPLLLVPRLLVAAVVSVVWVAGQGSAGPPSGCHLKPKANPVYAPICAAAKSKAACANLSVTCDWVPPPPPLVKPVDTDCMHWVKITSGPLGPNSAPVYKPARDGGLLVVGWQNSGFHPSAAPVGTQVICASVYGDLGHFDVDNNNNQCYLKDELAGGAVYPPFYIATFSRANLTWSTFRTGDTAPTNAYQLNENYLGRNLLGQDPTQSVMPGWVEKDGAKLGTMRFEDFGPHQVNGFQLATCHPPTSSLYVCDNATELCVAQNFSATGNCTLKPGQNPVYKAICAGLKTASACVNASATCKWALNPPPAPNNKTSFPTQQACAGKCIAPPPPPLSAAPCIRFGHTIPVANHLDATISQAATGISHTWSNIKFGDFSDWVNVFKPGTGTITLWENIGGVRDKQLYQLKGIPLTPGPLLVVIKVAASQVHNASGYWPPALPDSVETIAASYVDTDPSSKVRLFNLAPGTAQAGMTLNGKQIASNVAYGLGSSWMKVPTASAAFGFVDDTSKKTLTSKTFTPEQAPIGNTEVLLGINSNGGDDETFGMQVVSLVDAPEGGTCHP